MRNKKMPVMNGTLAPGSHHESSRALNACSARLMLPAKISDLKK
jgi:hypothetical protein